MSIEKIDYIFLLFPHYPKPSKSAIIHVIVHEVNYYAAPHHCRKVIFHDVGFPPHVVHEVKTRIKVMKQIVGLSSQNFIEINESSHTSYGGNQQWWEKENKRVSNYGCGVISTVDTELYITGRQAMKREQYTRFATERFKRFYHFLIARGVPFWKMCLGVLARS